MANNTLNTRIIIMNDTSANQGTSTKVLLKGEIGFEYTTDTASPPKIKVGDGTNTYADLPYATMTPVEITAKITSMISDFSSSIHTHANKTILDAITAAFTTQLKSNYDAAYTHSNSAHAPSNAQANIIESIKVNGTAQTISSKSVDIKVPITGGDVTVGSDMKMTIPSVAASKITGTLSTGNIPTLDINSKTSGVLDISRIPAAALERLVKVANDTARFALTTSNVQLGDSVLVTGTGLMYFVSDETKLNSEAGYTEYSGTVAQNNVTGKPNVMSGATSSAAGTGGLVPAPGAGEDDEYLKGDGTWGTPYTHPASHPASMITQDASHRFVTDTEITAWNGKVDKTTVATSSVLGLVKSSTAANKVSVGSDGIMSLNTVSTDILVNGANTLILNGGSSV